MMLRKAMAVGGMCAAAAMASIAGAPAALAAGHHMYTDDDNPGGKVTFQTYGDVVKLCDQQADGWAAYLKVKDLSQNKVKYRKTVGHSGHCEQWRASDGPRYNLKEGSMIRFTICLEKHGHRDFCDSADWRNDNY